MYVEVFRVVTPCPEDLNLDIPTFLVIQPSVPIIDVTNNRMFMW